MSPTSESRAEGSLETPSPEVAAVLPRDAPWTTRRRGILKWLEINAPPLASVYEGAVLIVCDESFPGGVVFVAHAIREIRNRLPDFLAGEVLGSSTDYSQLAEELHHRWVEDGFPSDGSISLADTSEPESTGPPRHDISPSLLEAVSQLVAAHLAGKMRNEEKATRLFEALAGGPAPTYVVRAWLQGTRPAHGYAHVRLKPLNPSDKAELVAMFSKFEDALGAISSRSYENMDDLDEILGSANR